MRIWMDVMRDLEHLIEAPEPIFDAWKAGGVEGLVIGPLVFHAGKLAIGHDRGRSIAPVPGIPAPTLTYDPVVGEHLEELPEGDPLAPRPPRSLLPALALDQDFNLLSGP